MRVGEAQSRWVPFVHCVRSDREGRRRCSDAQVPSFNVMREMKEKERERRALFELFWLASFLLNYDV